MAGETFIRQVGRRQRAPRSTGEGVSAQPPGAEARAAWTQMARYRTRAPKGIFIYAKHEDANKERERWQLEAMRANARVARDD